MTNTTNTPPTFYYFLISSALDFLRKDSKNIADFFRKEGKLNVMTTRELFDFITDIRITDVDEYLRKMEDDVHRRGPMTADQEVDDKVFMQAFIPRHLGEVEDYEVTIFCSDGCHIFSFSFLFFVSLCVLFLLDMIAMIMNDLKLTCFLYSQMYPNP